MFALTLTHHNINLTLFLHLRSPLHRDLDTLALLDTIYIFPVLSFAYLCPSTPFQSTAIVHHERNRAARKYHLSRYATSSCASPNAIGLTSSFLPLQDANVRQDATQKMEAAAQDRYVRLCISPFLPFRLFINQPFLQM